MITATRENWHWKNFTPKEMECKCGCGMLPKAEFMDLLQNIRTTANIPMVVTSGARCGKHNAEVSNTGLNGPHTTGLAVDIACNGNECHRIMRSAFLWNVPRMGVSQKGDSRFIHLDIIRGDDKHPSPTVWSY